MERIVRVFFIIFALCFLCSNNVMAETQVVEQQQTVIQPTPQDCTRTFPISYDKLFYLMLAATNEYNYKIKEIQSKSGYIIFETGYRKYLASIIYVAAEKSMLKITPYSGNYDFPITVPQTVFKYIEQYQGQSY